MEETFRDTQYIKAYREESVEQQHSLKHTNEMLNKAICDREKTISEMTTKVEGLQRRLAAQNDELSNK
jgi:hypothetical protein